MAELKKEDIQVIYEDKDLLVLDKPPGWVTTRESDKDQKNNVKYVQDWIKLFFPNNLLREGIVHRLDKGTSGVLVTAKDEDGLRQLKGQFKGRITRKHYWAMAGGDLPKEGNIKVPIMRSKYAFGKFKVGEEGKFAETEFERIQKISINGKVYSLIDINLKTGRTHQIRVHLSYMGWPILGDKLYGGQEILELNRPFLHARELTIKQPKSDKELVFESEMPSDLRYVINKYGKSK